MEGDFVESNGLERSIDGAEFHVSESPTKSLERPQDPDLMALYQLWTAKRGLRLMP